MKVNLSMWWSLFHNCPLLSRSYFDCFTSFLSLLYWRRKWCNGDFLRCNCGTTYFSDELLRLFFRVLLILANCFFHLFHCLSNLFFCTPKTPKFVSFNFFRIRCRKFFFRTIFLKSILFWRKTVFTFIFDKMFAVSKSLVAERFKTVVSFVMVVSFIYMENFKRGDEIAIDNVINVK